MIRKFPVTFFVSLICSLAGQAAVNVAPESVSGSGVALAYAADFSSNDLLNAGQPSLLSVTSSNTLCGTCSGPTDQWSFVNLNDGTYATGSTNNAYYSPSHLPATITFDLDVSINTMGYDITSIRSFMGWGFESRFLCHQVYTVEVSTVGSATYTQIASVVYEPFPESDFSGDYESKVTITEDVTGILATGVDSIRFTFADTGGTTGQGYALGTVIRELDAVGVPTVVPNVTPTSPAERQIVQRNSSNTANIVVAGAYAGTPDSIEARAVVRAGAENNGTDTGWQVIDASPSGNSFDSILPNVAAGGWYDVEIRTVTGGVPSDASKVERVGVGDIYLIAGQSNSASFGNPTYTPTDDRVSARSSAGSNTWVFAQDPMPIAGTSSGTGPNRGSAWGRFADLMIDDQNVPVGIVSMGIGASRISLWLPGNGNYVSRIKAAVESFPANGFRAFLWHQGEADATLGTSAADYQAHITSIIDESRLDAGWDIPWYLAEASYAPSSATLAAEEAILAGQRAAAFDDSLVFLGAATNDFHLTGKTWDGIHFNDVGLDEHAAQWFRVLTGTAPTEIANGDFEDNSLLSDNALTVTDPNLTSSPTVFEWHIVGADDISAADGTNGYFNPGSSTYSGAIDSTNGGVLSNMDGRHAASLSEGSAGNYFLQTLRARIQPDTAYALSVSIGIRDTGGGTFGGAKIELLAGGVSQGPGLTLTEADLNTFASGSASGQFTHVALSLDTSSLTSEGEQIGIRITKVSGGAGTYLDFDNVSLVAVGIVTPFDTWAMGNGITGGPDDDFDNDGIRNLVEFALGYSPTGLDHPLVPFSINGGALRLTRRIAGPAGLEYVVQSSTTLVDGSWATVPGITTTPVSDDGTFETVDLTRAGGWVPSGTTPEFFRLGVQLED